MLYATYIAIASASGLLTLGLGFFAFLFRKGTPGAWAFLWLMVFSSVWTLAIVPFLITPNLQAKILWTKLEYVGVAGVPITWFFFILRGMWSEGGNRTSADLPPF